MGQSLSSLPLLRSSLPCHHVIPYVRLFPPVVNSVTDDAVSPQPCKTCFATWQYALDNEFVKGCAAYANCELPVF